MEMENQIRQVIRNSLLDIQVELGEEFDRNFERKAFFAKAWQRRCGTHKEGKPLLIDTGSLRRSFSSSINGNRITFTSTEPYAEIHNSGGTIIVTQKMRRYFWYKYKEAMGGFAYTRKGEKRSDKRNRELTAEAEFFRAMALKRVGSKIIIPRRQFIGMAPEVEEMVRNIIEENLNDFFNNGQISISVKQ